MSVFAIPREISVVLEISFISDCGEEVLGVLRAASADEPKDGSTHWSVRKLARELKISKDAVHRIWHKAGVKPHRLERYMASDDPDFESKAADVIALYCT